MLTYSILTPSLYTHIVWLQGTSRLWTKLVQLSPKVLFVVIWLN